MNTSLQKFGWAYVWYHLALFAIGLYDAASKYWQIGDFLEELTLGFILYPVLVPALTLCGVHEGCSAIGRTTQVLLTGLTLCWAIIGWRVVLSKGWKWLGATELSTGDFSRRWTFNPPLEPTAGCVLYKLLSD